MSGSAHAEPPGARLRLSVHLRELASKAQDDDLSLGELMGRLEGRVYTLLLVLLSAPFCQPVALPGFSTPFGILIALLGLRFAFRQAPWLPKRFLATRIPPRFLPSVLRASSRLLAWVERFLHPRMTGLFAYPLTHFLAGATIFVCGLLLLLPLPVPFSNLLPALTVLLLAASVAERDGMMLAAGFGVFLVTLIFFASIFLGGVAVVEWLEGHFSGLFDPDDEAPGIVPTRP